MSLDKQNKLFQDKYCNGDDYNIFESINNYCADSVRLKNQNCTRLSDRECLTATLTNKLPDDIGKRRIVSEVEYNYADTYVSHVLREIDDKQIHDSIRLSIRASKEAHNLIYRYDPTLSEGQKSRIRIICRMIWFNLYNERNRNVW